VPATRIFTMKDIFGDAHFKARDMLVDVPHEKLGTVKVAGVVPKLSDTPGALRCAGGPIGRDTRQILASVAGYSNADIDALLESGAIRETSNAANPAGAVTAS